MVLNQGIVKAAEEEAGRARKAGAESKKLAADNHEMAERMTEIVMKAKEIIAALNAGAAEIEAASQEQTSGATEHASGLTEVSATIQELSATAKQITANVNELVVASGEVISLLGNSEKDLLGTVTRLEEVGKSSRRNSEEIGELGQRSALINEMVDLIKEVANKINILSINASIEASRSGEAGSGFSVVAAEIRELSKETLSSAKNVEKAARDITMFLDSIVVASESEAENVVESGRTVKDIYEKMEQVVGKVNNNYTFTQKIDASTRQQETGSRQAADTMRQMAEISRQTAETARQIAEAVKEIVRMGEELNGVVHKITPEEDTASPSPT
jgi:methyl-accepting chemotaxis protein